MWNLLSVSSITVAVLPIYIRQMPVEESKSFCLSDVAENGRGKWD
jgi:hypothetical protein